MRVRLESGTTETYGFVVGADGVHSAVRRAVGRWHPRRSLMTESSWRFIAPNPGVDCWTVWSGGRGTFLLIPVDPDQVYGYASAPAAAARARTRSWLATPSPPSPSPCSTVGAAVLRDRGPLHHSPVEELRCERWSRGRVALIGDAAHATAPVWAQGAALALEDGLVLADLLADPVSGRERAPSSSGCGGPGSRASRRPPTRCRASPGCPAGCATSSPPRSVPGPTERPTDRCAPPSPKR